MALTNLSAELVLPHKPEYMTHERTFFETERQEVTTIDERRDRLLFPLFKSSLYQAAGFIHTERRRVILPPELP